MSKGESPRSGWASYRPRRKRKLSRPSARRPPPNPNNKVSCERLARLVSLSLDVHVRWKFVGKSGTNVKRRYDMSILRLVRNFALLAVLALAAHTAAGADKGGNHCSGGPCGYPGASCPPKFCVCVAAGQRDVCVSKKLFN